MRRFIGILLAPLALAAAACSSGSDQDALDQGLSSDLSLAAQVQQPYPQQFMSPYEMYGQYPQYGAPQPYQPMAYGYPYPQPVVQQAPRTVQQAPRTVQRVSTPAPVRREPIRNTKRDAIIGATAGAVLGAVTSKDKLKGAVIGAAAGGALGAIIGHTVDVKY